MTLNEALFYGHEKIGKREAKIFLSHITGYSVSGVLLYSHEKISVSDYNLYTSFIARRLAGEPLQYIIGQWEFMGLPFITDRRALIPRPETELLVEDAYEFIRKKIGENGGSVRVLDVCTGSGCIPISIACLTDGRVEITATDISKDAICLARENAHKNGLSAERINFLQTDLMDGIKDKFDVIISNPPYILSGDMATLSPTVRDHEPHLALDGGTDGMDFYRRLIPQSKNALNHGGALFLEIGPPAVMGLMADIGFSNINLRRDYAELERIVTGTHEGAI